MGEYIYIYMYDYVYLHVSFVDHNNFLPFTSQLDQTLLASGSGKSGLMAVFYIAKHGAWPGSYGHFRLDFSVSLLSENSSSEQSHSTEE